MALIDWEQGMSVNVREIDLQHKKLIDTINELHAAMRKGTSKNMLGSIIAKLIEYTAVHFSTEEKYFDRLAYPGSAAHKLEHAEFVRKVTEFQTGFEKGKLFLSIDIMNFLRDWLTTHICGSDKSYGPFFNKYGIS